MPETRLSRRNLLRWGGLAAAGVVGAGAVMRAARPRSVPAPSTTAPAAKGGSASPPPRRLVALIANSLGNTLTVADGRTLEPIATIGVGREPHKFRLTRDGKAVYSCNTTSNELIELDLATLRARRRIPMLDPYNVLFTRDGRFLYKVAYRYDFVEIHDGDTFRPLKRLRTGRQPSHMWFSPDGRWFVNSNQFSDSVSVIDTRAMRIARTLRVDPQPAGVQISQDGHYLFVASHVGTISVFGTDEWTLIKKIRSGKGAHEMVATRDGRTIFVTNRYEDTASVFDVPTQRIVAKFPVPGGPDMPMLSPDGSQLWVSGRFGDTASVIDAKSLKLLATFPTGRSPHGVFLGFTPAT
jgi:YVTN family beta-propeller protein